MRYIPDEASRGCRCLIAPAANTRYILHAALAEESPSLHLADRVQERFQKWGGVELPRFDREQIRPALDFGKK